MICDYRRTIFLKLSICFSIKRLKICDFIFRDFLPFCGPPQIYEKSLLYLPFWEQGIVSLQPERHVYPLKLQKVYIIKQVREWKKRKNNLEEMPRIKQLAVLEWPNFPNLKKISMNLLMNVAKVDIL